MRRWALALLGACCSCGAEGVARSGPEQAGAASYGSSPSSGGEGSVGVAASGAGALPTPTPEGSSQSGAPSFTSCARWLGDIPPNRTLVCIGQDTGEIDAYVRAFGAPGGAMLYTNVADLAGFAGQVDFGAGRQSLPHWLEQPYPMALQLGVSLAKAQGDAPCRADHAADIVSGRLDGALSSMAVELAATARPILLRFGYEFDNSDCHSYEPVAYRAAFRHAAELFRTLGASNVKMVWHAWGGAPLDVSAWYPGDDIVDYVGISVFPIGQQPGKLEAVASFAEAHRKPLMVAESTPQAQNPLERADSWAWFEALLTYVKAHDVRVLSYINQNWDAQSVWAAQRIWGDSRIQGSAVEGAWRAALAEPRFLNSSDSLYRELGCSP